MNPWLYAILCVVVPMLWGVVVVALSNAIERIVFRRAKTDVPEAPEERRSKRSLPPIDYHI